MSTFVIENLSAHSRVVCVPDEGLYSANVQVRLGEQWTDAARINPKSCWSLSASGRLYALPYSRCEQPAAGELLLEGAIIAAEHRWKITDHISFASEMIKIVRRWSHAHEQTQSGIHLCLPIRIDRGADLRIMLPGINYNNNPNADPKRLVPRFAEELPAWCLYEEHRFPIPFAHFEFANAEARMRAALLTQPSPVDLGLADHANEFAWWSLGAKVAHDHIDLLVTSGMVATNGEFGVIYGKQNTLETYGDTSLDIPPDAELQKTVYLDVGAVERAGYGFAEVLWRAYDIFKPSTAPAHSSAEVVRLKTNAAKARYYEDGEVSGFLCLPEKNAYGRPPYFLWGWTGQSLRLASCLFQIGESSGDAELIRMAAKSVDFFVRNNLGRESGLTFLRYLVNERKWEANETPRWGSIVSSRQFGEAMGNLADVLLSKQDSQTWMTVFEKAVRFLAREESLADGGLYPRFWNLDGTIPPGIPTGSAGVFCVSPLAKASRIIGDAAFTECAVRRLAAYFDYNTRDLKTPYWGGTLDACCEEKEAAIAFMRAALDVYDVTQERKFLDWAHMAAEWILTFVYFWDTGFREGTPCRGRMQTTGWSSVSVQNQHIDVFAPCVEFLRLGEYSGEQRFVEIGKMLFHAITQSIATPEYMWSYDDPDKHNVSGEQAEQFFQTNYFQGRTMDRSAWRGGVNTWNPSWIIAHVLWQAIEMNKRGY